MRTEYILFVQHTTSILAKLSTWCFEHSGIYIKIYRIISLLVSVCLLHIHIHTHIHTYTYVSKLSQLRLKKQTFKSVIIDSEILNIFLFFFLPKSENLSCFQNILLYLKIDVFQEVIIAKNNLEQSRQAVAVLSKHQY